MTERKIDLPACWLGRLSTEFDQSYMHELRTFLQAEKQNGKLVYPPGPQIFNALKSTPLNEVKVVVLGQDPYHGPGQAHGLSFSVPQGVPTPPSLQNIFKELQSDLEIALPSHGCLQQWADRGVLLLNAVLTVQHKLAGSHANKGWEQFTDRVIQVLDSQRENLVFLLWGSYAQRKGAFIDTRKHCVMKAPHPSPLSAHRGFFGCKHFSQANQYLIDQGLSAVDWSIV